MFIHIYNSLKIIDIRNVSTKCPKNYIFASSTFEKKIWNGVLINCQKSGHVKF